MINVLICFIKLLGNFIIQNIINDKKTKPLVKAAWLKKFKNNTMFRNYTNYEVYFRL